MIYSFNMKDAVQYGDREAIMLANFNFWLAKNKAEGKNQRDGRTWTFNTIAGFEKLFPCWTGKQIRRILDSLINQNVLIRSNFNQKGYDRTSWYALTDESALLLNCPKGQMDLPKRANGSAQKGKPIPDSKQDIKQDKTESELSAVRVAHYLHKKLIEETPEVKANPDSWVKDIERCIRIDGRSEKDLISIIDWMHTGDKFWVANIQSGKKLREKYNTLIAQKRQRSSMNNPEPQAESWGMPLI